MAKWVCRILGVIFVVVGSIVFLRNAPVDKYHNGLHLITGLIALGIGFAGSIAAARRYCLAFGLFYVALGLLGVVVGDSSASYALRVGPMHLNIGDHVFHLVLGMFLTASGFLTKRTAALQREPAIGQEYKQ